MVENISNQVKSLRLRTCQQINNLLEKRDKGWGLGRNPPLFGDAPNGEVCVLGCMCDLFGSET